MIDYITVVLVLYFISYFYYLYISQGIGKNAQFFHLCHLPIITIPKLLIYFIIPQILSQSSPLQQTLLTL